MLKRYKGRFPNVICIFLVRILNNLIPLCLFSYHKILSSDFLRQHKHNLVIHAPNLPKGKGWSPLFWQV
ncbi:hypothetical protein [Helicobacter apodemus]|uniref:hypothetical protein n=1 Tax=Helicobacter apodemus TaxID=135569 RepID=UPI000A6C603B|nr:hypothetical protein [Helicobacter apodemus]